MKICSSVLLVLVILLNTSFIPNPKKINLRLKLNKGDRFKMEMINKQSISQEIMGQKQDMTQAFRYVYSFEVLEKNKDGLADVKVTFLEVDINMKSSLGETSYKSSDPPEEISPQLQIFAFMVGQSYAMKINTQGKVQTISGVDEMMDKLIEAMEISEDSVGQILRNNLKSQYGDSSVKADMESMFSIYPQKPVRIGDSWSNTSNRSQLMPRTITNTWTLRGVKDGLALIDVASKIMPYDAAKPMEVMGMTIRYDIQGTQKGQTKIDTKTGWVVESTVFQDLGGEVTMKNNPITKEDATWPIALKSEVKTKSL